MLLPLLLISCNINYLFRIIKGFQWDCFFLACLFHASSSGRQGGLWLLLPFGYSWGYLVVDLAVSKFGIIQIQMRKYFAFKKVRRFGRINTPLFAISFLFNSFANLKFIEFVSYFSTSNKFSGPPNFRLRHEVHNFRQADFLYICHCVIHNLKSLVISVLYM